MTNFDTKFKATDRAKGLDEKYNISNQATTGWRGLTSYFEKALGTPTGQKVRDFYAQTDKQVRDIHTEARRLADLKSGKTAEGGAAPTTTEAAPTEAAPAEAASGVATEAGSLPPTETKPVA